MTEVLNSMKLLKMYAWEEPFQHTISGKSFVTTHVFILNDQNEKHEKMRWLIYSVHVVHGMFTISPPLSQVLFFVFYYIAVCSVIISACFTANLFEYSSCSSISTRVIFPTLISLTSTRVIVPVLISLTFTGVIIHTLTSSTSTGVIFPVLMSLASTSVIVHALTPPFHVSSNSTGVIIHALTSSTFTGTIIPDLMSLAST